MIISIISIILLVIFSFILLSIYNNKKKQLMNEYEAHRQIGYEEYYKNRIKAEQKKIDEESEQYRQMVIQRNTEWTSQIEEQRATLIRGLNERKQAVEETIKQLENRQQEAEKNYRNLVNNEKEKINIELEFYRNQQLEQFNSFFAAERASKIEAAAAEHEKMMLSLEEQKREKQAELFTLTEAIEDFRKKQDVINAEIMRRREVEEKQDFYRVCLDETAVQDIQILLNIREKLISRENLDKLIYDVYVSKAVLEMTKRVLGGRTPSGIYKITRLKTGEIYIGKSTDIKKRWTEHCKTAYGVGSIAHSILHTTIRRDGIENFTFELLEEVPKDKLTEREKYWITFYGSKEYGLNERIG